MNKIIIAIVCGCFILSGLFIYFYSQIDDVIITEEITDDNIVPNVSGTPGKIIEIDYNKIKKKSKIIKCTAKGCV